MKQYVGALRRTINAFACFELYAHSQVPMVFLGGQGDFSVGDETIT